MHIPERLVGDAVVLAPVGRIDLLTAEDFRIFLLPKVAACVAARKAVVLDFGGVDYISSAGLRVLMLAARSARAAGGSVSVADLQPVVKEIFEISRFDKVLPCHAGVDQAVAAASPAR